MLAKLRERLTQRSAAATPAAAVPASPPPQLAEFKRIMGRDEVTGLPNRVRFMHLLAHESDVASSTGTELSVLVIDWPGYRFTGTPGLRDRRLAGIAARITDTLNRKHDIIGRVDEARLAVLLPFTDAAGADRVARKIQLAAQDALSAEPPPVPSVEALEAEVPTRVFGRSFSSLDDEEGEPEADAARVDQTVSIGLASYCGKGPLVEDALLQAAEQAASFASMNGANQIVRCDAGEMI